MALTIKIDHDKVIKKLLAGEKLTDVEQEYVNVTLKRQRHNELLAKKYQARINLKIKYCEGKYDPTDEEIDKEVERLMKK